MARADEGLEEQVAKFHRRFDGHAKRAWRYDALNLAAREWDALRPDNSPTHNHLDEIIRVADAYYKFIVTGKLEDRETYVSPRDRL